MMLTFALNLRQMRKIRIHSNFSNMYSTLICNIFSAVHVLLVFSLSVIDHLWRWPHQADSDGDGSSE